MPKDSLAAPFNAWVRGVEGTRDDRLLFGGAYFASPGGIPQLTQGDAQRLKFDHTYNEFRFDYSANGVSASGDMQFQTYMKGVDADWTSWSPRTEREFTELSAGHWDFKVRARKSDGEISGEGEYTFTIRPAWYATWWFAVIQVLFVLGILILPRHFHQNEFIQEVLTTFAVIVPIVYLGDAVSGFLEHYYTGEVAFVKVLMSAVLALCLDPIQNYLKKHVKRHNEKHRERHLHHKAQLAELHHLEHHHPGEHHPGEHHPEHHPGEHHPGEHHVERHHSGEHHPEHRPAGEHDSEQHHSEEHRSDEHPAEKDRSE